jgi:hypothetical protein
MACKSTQAAGAPRVLVHTQLFNVNFVIKAAVRAQLPEYLHVCGDCGLKAARAVQSVLQ